MSFCTVPEIDGSGTPWRFATATDRPETVDALRQVVADRVAQGHAIYPQGGATSLDYGGTPRAPGVAVDSVTSSTASTLG